MWCGLSHGVFLLCSTACCSAYLCALLLSCLHTQPQVGLVSQEPTLFQTSILENIALGKPGATVEEVQEAARRANAHKFISVMPKGYDTQVRACTALGSVPSVLVFELRGHSGRHVHRSCCARTSHSWFVEPAE